MNSAPPSQKLGNWGSTELWVNWEELFQLHGRSAEVLAAEKSLGNLLRVFGAGGLMLGIFLLISQSSSDVGLLVICISLLAAAYASYLRRNRNDFDYRRRSPNLLQLQQKTAQGAQSRVELQRLFSHPLAVSLDKLFFQQSQNFLPSLVQMLLSSAAVRVLASRLGLDQARLQELVSISGQIQPGFNANLQLWPAAMHKAVELELEWLDETAIFCLLSQTVWKDKLLSWNISRQDMEGLELWVRNQNRKQRYKQLWEVQSVLKPKGNMNRAFTSRITPTLNKYAEDYTLLAATGRFEISLGKEEQMQQVIKILQKQSGAATIVIGDPGVGKSHFLKHLGVRMVVEDVPKSLRDKRLVAFNFNRAFTDSQKFEDFKVILQRVIDEVAASGDIILILDNMDQMLNIRADLQAELVTMLVNAVDRHNLQVVGTASSDGFNRFIKPIPSLAATWQQVVIPEPGANISLQILIDALPDLESKYGISIQVGALKQVVQLAPKFAHERVMPDKGLDLLEESILEARDKGLQFVTAAVVAEVVSRKVGVAVGELTSDEAARLANLETEMHKRVVGQEMAIKAVANALRRARAGLQKQSKPIASFLFFGPTGVGKTEVAKTLAKTYYGDEKLMVRVDMSEYQEEQNLTRLIGKQEGTKFEGGYLTDAVRQKPFSLVLFDEIEKANPKVLDLFLQMLDEGHITDGAGRRIDFSNTIIIATSNAASREIADLVAAGKPYNEVYEQTQPKLRQIFRVEFLNRFDKVIMFKTLQMIEVQEIARRMLGKLKEQMMDRGYAIEYTESFLSNLVKAGYHPVYGAREMARVIQEEVEDKIAQAVITGKLVPGGKMELE